jgi:hypothetical protein
VPALIAGLAAASLVATTSLAAPAAPDDPEGPRPDAAQTQPAGAWIQLELVGDSPLAEDTLADLRALLERDGIAVELEPVGPSVGPTGPSVGPLAVVRVEFRPGAAVSVSVDIRDAVTNKRIGRDLDLESVPRDGRSLMIAATADELLDASWAEIALGHWQTRAEEEPVPEVVSEAVERELEPPVIEPPRPPRLAHRVAAGPVGAWTSGGLGVLGGALSYELRFVGRVGVELGGRGFGVLAPRLRSGRVVGGGGLGSLGVVVATRAPGASSSARFELDVGAHVAAGGLSLTGITRSTQVHRRAAAPLVELGGTLTPSVVAGRWVRLELPISVAGLVRGVRVHDANGPVIAMSGVSIALGLRVAWISGRG